MLTMNTSDQKVKRILRNRESAERSRKNKESLIVSLEQSILLYDHSIKELNEKLRDSPLSISDFTHPLFGSNYSSSSNTTIASSSSPSSLPSMFNSDLSEPAVFI